LLMLIFFFSFIQVLVDKPVGPVYPSATHLTD
jgi:hypothetical protein